MITLRQAIDALNAKFQEGLRQFPTDVYLWLYKPQVIVNAPAVGLSLAYGEVKRLRTIHQDLADWSRLDRAKQIIEEHSQSYITNIRSVLGAAEYPIQRRGPSSAIRIKNAIAALPLNSLDCEGWNSTDDAAVALSRRMRYPFDNPQERMRRWVGETRHKPFEDDGFVSWDSPHAEWYLKNDRNVWNLAGDLFGGDSEASTSFQERIVMLRVFGYDPDNMGDSLMDQLGGYMQNSDNWIMGIISAGAMGTLNGTERLKLEMMLKRNLWCYRNGITPPSKAQVGKGEKAFPIDEIMRNVKKFGWADKLYQSKTLARYADEML